MGAPGLQGLLPVAHHEDLDSHLLQQGLEHQLIDRVVLRRQHAQGAFRFQRSDAAGLGRGDL
ncbi:MAG: hypothetical protein Q7T23_19420, partial [Phenylobacterium sp.]|nr:hypothetical protein [Phenylobacterium sp.]